MQPRVLVTDAHERALLATVRCLAASGFEVTATANRWIAPGLWSTATRRRSVIADSTDQDRFVDDLERLLRARRQDLLLPGTDQSLLAISRHRERLAPFVRIALPPGDVVERVLNRAEVSAASRAVGLDPPDERLCANTDESLSAAESFGYPVIVKPVDIVAGSQIGTLRRRAAEIAHDPRALTVLTTALGRCLVQRRISGPVVSFGGVASDEGLLACAVSRYERLWPVDAGSGCFLSSIPAPEELVESVSRLVSELRWEGMFQLEMIERGDGRFCAIDFNPRPYGSLALAVSAGAPIPAIWCEWALGGRPARRDARAGVRYRWEDADLRHAAWQLRHGNRRLALAAVRPHRSVKHAYLSARDPLPPVVRSAELLLRAQEKARARRTPLEDHALA
jgi:predicted ATP-grasp superfamily ATP-dependent carboligase